MLPLPEKIIRWPVFRGTSRITIRDVKTKRSREEIVPISSDERYFHYFVKSASASRRMRNERGSIIRFITLKFSNDSVDLSNVV